MIAPLIWSAEPVIVDLRFLASNGKILKAYLVKAGYQVVSAPAILFVHWFEPQSPDSNRSQLLARDVVVSLLLETMWFEPQRFNKRNPAQDYDKSLEQAADLSKAFDFLLSQAGIDKSRVA